MDHFRLGPLEIARVEETRTYFDGTMFFPELTRETLEQHRSWLTPYWDYEGHRFPCVFQSFVIKHSNITILIDACFGNDKERPDFELAHHLRNPYLERLAAAGVRPEDVNIVLCTHFHPDHVGWNTRLADGRWVPTFPNARYVFSREEYARFAPEAIAKEAPAFLEVFEDSVLPVIQSGQAEFVSGEQQIHEHLTVYPTPGHTAGHISIHARGGDDTAIFLGDVIHNPIQMAIPELNSSFCEDQATARITRRRMLEVAAEKNHLLVPAHFIAPHVGRVRASGQGFSYLPGL
jgi:glyoxylase-like metal-dependent hydrolase (beta-lactamase superfamily II)